MNYFDWLRITRKEDTKDNFIKYLVFVLGSSKEEAEKESKIYYKE